MRRARLVWLLAGLTSLGVAACGESPRPRLPPRAPLWAETPSGALPESPRARYSYHPREPAAFQARALLPGGAVLLVGDHGERWTVQGDAVEAAPELSPESLLGIESRSDGFVFLGKSGTTYHAASPLGPFERSSAPPIPFARVRAAGGPLVGLERGGWLHRSEDGGASWQRMGPAGVRFEDALIREDGMGLALAVPEAIWETRDRGATFRPVETPAVGATSLMLGEAGHLAVLGALGGTLWEPSAVPAFSPLPEAFTTGVLSLGVKAPEGPSSDALLEGRAVLLGAEWLEVREDGARYRLLRGSFGSHLRAEPLRVLAGCDRAWLSALGKFAYLACTRSEGPDVTQPVAVFRSVDGARTWKEEPYVIEGRAEELTLGVAADGELLVSGICAPATRGPGCRPAGVFRRAPGVADGGPSVVVDPVPAPSLVSAALAMALSPDGRSVYLLGRRTKGDALGAFVSHDAGRTFEASELDALGPLPTAGSRSRGEAPVSVAGSVSARGTASFVFQRGNQAKVIVLDEAGRVVAAAEPPAAGARVGAAGQRFFAFDPPSSEAWESMDAGATWVSLGPLAADPCGTAGPCRVTVACADSGCVIGDRVSRIGWGEAPRRALLSPGGVPRTERREQKVGVPFVCSLDRTEWQRLPGALSPPDAGAAAIGRMAWFVAGITPATAAVSSLRMRGGPGARIDEVRLLEPAARPDQVAFDVSLQVEGVAAVRFPVPTRDAPSISNVELAWDDVLSGRVGRAKVPDAGPLRPGDFENSKDGTPPKRANPALLSIASGGLYYRPHASLGDAQPAFFVDGSTVRALPPVTWPAAATRLGRSEMVRVGQSHVSLRVGGASVVRAVARGNASILSAVRLGWADPSSHGLSQTLGIAYAGSTPGMQLTVDPPGPEPATALLHPFGEGAAIFESPFPVPTQEALPLASRACTERERSATPRVVAPFQAGTRRPVTVVDPLEPPREFLTETAVLHGSPEAPCVAAYDAVPLRKGIPGRTEGSREAALVFGDERERSWLFRSEAAQGGKPGSVEYRAMTCRADTTAEIPIEVFREAGTSVVRE